MAPFFCTTEPFTDVVRRTVHKLALRVHHIGESERLPGGSPGLLGRERAGLERKLKREAVVLEQRRGVVRVRDVIDVGKLDARRLEAEIDRVVRQLPYGEGERPLAVLDAREALFLGGGDDGAVLDEAGGGIVEGGVEAQRDHAVISNSSC